MVIVGFILSAVPACRCVLWGFVNTPPVRFLPGGGGVSGTLDSYVGQFPVSSGTFPHHHPTPTGEWAQVCRVPLSKRLLPVPLVDASLLFGNMVNRARVRYTGRFVGNM